MPPRKKSVEADRGWGNDASFTDLAVNTTHWKLVGMGAIRCGSILGVGSEMRCEVPALC